MALLSIVGHSIVSGAIEGAFSGLMEGVQKACPACPAQQVCPRAQDICMVCPEMEAPPTFGIALGATMTGLIIFQFGQKLMVKKRFRVASTTAASTTTALTRMTQQQQQQQQQGQQQGQQQQQHSKTTTATTIDSSNNNKNSNKENSKYRAAIRRY